jgi:hypothetical protein
MTATSNLFTVDRPKDHDIEAVRPHMRKHLQPFKFLISGSEVTVQGTNYADAPMRAMLCCLILRYSVPIPVPISTSVRVTNQRRLTASANRVSLPASSPTAIQGPPCIASPAHFKSNNVMLRAESCSLNESRRAASSSIWA